MSRKVQENISISVDKKVEELRDSSRREKNIILHGVEEIEDANPNIRKETDTRFVKDLIGYLEGDVDSVMNVVRIGKRNVSDSPNENKKSRPVKITMKDTVSKRTIMKNLSKLKDAAGALKKVKITHDMSKTERELNMAKVQEAREKNEMEEGNYKHIVRGPPWDRRVVRIKLSQ